MSEHQSEEPIVGALLRAIKPMRNNRLGNYIAPGLVSVMVGGEVYGKVRLFESSRETLEFITPHSHRFDFTALVLEGEVHNSLFSECVFLGQDGSEEWVQSSITQVCGADGMLNYDHVRDSSPTFWARHTTRYSAGETYSMGHKEVHSIKFSKGAKVLMFEGPQLTERSVMIEPWVDGRLVPTFRVEGWMFSRLGDLG